MQLFSQIPVVFSLVALTSLWAARAQVITSSSRTVVINNNASYFVPGTPVASFSFSGNASEKLAALGSNGKVPLIPFSFITTSNSTFGPADLSAVSSLWSQIDDVWTPAFLQGACLHSRSCGRH